MLLTLLLHVMMLMHFILDVGSGLRSSDGTSVQDSGPALLLLALAQEGYGPLKGIQILWWESVSGEPVVFTSRYRICC